MAPDARSKIGGGFFDGRSVGFGSRGPGGFGSLPGMHSRALPNFFPRLRFAVPLLWLIFGVWVLVLVYASTRQGVPGPFQPVLGFDKVEHFLFFFWGALSLGAAIRATAAIRWSTIFLIVFLVLCSLGLADEINQLFVPNRSGADPFDWMADLAGTAAGLAVLRRFYGKRKAADPAPSAGD